LKIKYRNKKKKN